MGGHSHSVSSNYNWKPGLGPGYDAIQQAVALKGNCSELEQDLIDALATRHTKEARDQANPAELNMGNTDELNAAFANAMAPLYVKYTGNLDVAALYVESTDPEDQQKHVVRVAILRPLPASCLL